MHVCAVTLSQASIHRVAKDMGFSQIEPAAIHLLQRYGAAHIEKLLHEVRRAYPRAKRLQHKHVKHVGQHMEPHMDQAYYNARQSYVPMRAPAKRRGISGGHRRRPASQHVTQHKRPAYIRAVYDA